MKKARGIKVTALLLAVLFALPLVGCHGAKGPEEFRMPQSFDTERQIEITFWAKNDTNKAQTRIYEKAIADFTALYPNVQVAIRLYTDYGRIYNDVITNISTGTTPNVCITYPDHIATYLMGAGTVTPLDGLMHDAKYGLSGSEVRFDAPRQDEIVPQFLAECALRGSYYALPFMRSTEACYVNKTYVEALGYALPETLTWDFVWEVADAAAKKAEDGTFLLNGQKVMLPFIYKSTDNMMIQALRQQGADYSTAEGEVLLDSPAARELLRTVARHTKAGAFSTFKISGYPANFLNAGQCVFAVDSTAGATWMGSDAPLADISADKFVQFETAVLPVPQQDPAHPQMISQGPSICIFNKQDPQEVLASWLFVQYLLTNEVQIAYAKTEGYVPVTKKAQQSEAYQDYLSRCGEDNSEHYAVKLQASRLLLDNMENTFVTPVFSGSASLRDAAGQLIENVTKSVKRRENVDDAYLDTLFREVTALYRLDQNGVKNAASAAEKADLGPLPKTASALLICLAAVWAIIAAYAVILLFRRKHGGNKTG